MDKRAPVLTLADQRSIFSLTPDQARALEAVVLRYYAWQASDRAADPWASGAGRAMILRPSRCRRNCPAASIARKRRPAVLGWTFHILAHSA